MTTDEMMAYLQNKSTSDDKKYKLEYDYNSKKFIKNNEDKNYQYLTS